MKRRYIQLVIIALWSTMTYAQFKLDGEFRSRTEYRNGYGSIIPDAADAGYAISSRLRLNATYEITSYKFYMSLQDVMVWGENRQLKTEDSNNSFAIFQAWADIKLGEGFSTKIGRQVLAYDDQRVLGEADWAQQARNHDAALLRYHNGKFKMDSGFAFNQDFSSTTGNPSGFQSIGTIYNTTGTFSYKTMQFLHLKQKWNSFSASALLLNNGFQNFTEDDELRGSEGVSNLQTFGTHLNYKKGSLGLTFHGYVQRGERQNKVKVGGAYLAGLDLNYGLSKKVKLGLGIENISGNKTNTSNKTEAFVPLFGTNHKFNGLMDYFYVGNHANSVGLRDVHVSASFNLHENSSLFLKILNFRSAEKLASGEKTLGSEVDLVYSKKYKGYTLAFGYSHLFASEGMYELKGISKADAAKGQNWAWAQLTVRPKFLSEKREN